jgi:phospholipid/cholesterol/gamma-HCH transport system ATP-binding protein
MADTRQLLEQEGLKKIILQTQNLSLRIDEQHVLSNINFEVYQDEIFAIVGESGCGKTTLLRTILMLLEPSGGIIKIFGKEIAYLSEISLRAIQRRWGVMFQHGALFSSLTVLENILFPLSTQTDLHQDLQKEIAYLKITLVGLPFSAANKYPAELSGGMKKRAALARAIALDPELLFLDEPTSGLDPHSAHELDELILDLGKSLNLTMIIITHDLDTLWMVTDRVGFLGEGKILAISPMEQLIHNTQPAIKEYFSGLRAERAKEAIKKGASRPKRKHNKE